MATWEVVFQSKGGIALSLDKMNRILEISSADFVAVVQPGVRTAAFQDETEAHGLFIPPIQPAEWIAVWEATSQPTRGDLDA